MDTKSGNDKLLQDLTSISDRMWLHSALGSAIDLGIPDAIDDKAASCEAIASKLNLHAPTVYRLMRGLAANGYFKVAGEQMFAHTEGSRALRRDAQPSLRAMVQLGNMKPMQQAWQHLSDSMRDGKSSFSHAHGKELYAYLPTDKAASEIFNASMIAFSQPQLREVAEKYTDFGRCKNVLDVAGGLGHLLAAVLNHYPALHGAVLDLQHLQAHAKGLLNSAGCGERASFVTGNMMENLPTGYDCYMVKNALWNWKDDDAIRVLRNMRKALETKPGRVLVIEELLTRDNLATSSLFDLQMLVATTGGRARTEQDFVAMGNEVGLRHERTMALGHTHLMEFFPN